MKTCPACLDSVEVAAVSCPSCGARFFIPAVQPIARPVSQMPRVQEPRPGTSKASKINPLVRLYSLVILAIAVLAIGSTIALSNNAESNVPESTPTAQPKELESTQPKESSSPEPENSVVKASSIMTKLTEIGICDEIEYYSFPLATYGTDDLYRVCVVPSFTKPGGDLYNSIDKYVSVYTGEILSGRFADIDNLKVFEVAIVGDGWTVVSNYYPATNKTYMDDPDIKSMVDLLGGRTIGKE
jgi:hypothetical protein